MLSLHRKSFICWRVSFVFILIVQTAADRFLPLLLLCLLGNLPLLCPPSLSPPHSLFSVSAVLLLRTFLPPLRPGRTWIKAKNMGRKKKERSCFSVLLQVRAHVEETEASLLLVPLSSTECKAVVVLLTACLRSSEGERAVCRRERIGPPSSFFLLFSTSDRRGRRSCSM